MLLGQPMMRIVRLHRGEELGMGSLALHICTATYLVQYWFGHLNP